MENKLMRRFSMIMLIIVALIAFGLGSVVLYKYFEIPISSIQEHYAVHPAMIYFPLAIISAMGIILVLLATVEGPIEFEFIGFRFRGASGPIMLWVFSFLAISFSVKLLWDLK